MPLEVDARLYFWHQFPYGMPGLITVFLGVLFCALLVRVVMGSRQRRPLYISLLIATLGLGSHGLQAAVTALMKDQAAIRVLATFFFVIAMPASPAVLNFLHEITRRKYRGISAVSFVLWAITIVAMIWIALTGFHPRIAYLRITGSAAVQPVNLVMVVWYCAMIIGIGPLGLFILWREFGPFGRRRARPALVLAGIIFAVLSIVNLPIYLGYLELPLLSGYYFIPLALFGYDAFRAGFRDLSRVLFRDLGLFYIINLALGLFLLGIAMFAAFVLSRESYHDPRWTVVLPSMFGAASMLGVGMLVAGMNPSKPINQYGATSAYCIAFMMIQFTAGNLGLDLIIALRISQLLWMIQAAFISVFPRFIFAALDRPMPRFMWVLDIIAMATAAASFSPWMFPGYYQYDFGLVSAIGYLFAPWAAAGFVVFFYLFPRVPGLLRRSHGRNRVYILVILFLVLSGWSTLPATLGFAMPLYGLYAFFPAAMWAFVSIRKGALVSNVLAFRTNNRLTRVVTVVTLPILLVMFPLVSHEPRSLLHLAIVGVPILLFAYQLTHFLARPISAQLIEGFDLQLEARGDAEQARREADEARQESDELNQLSRRINELTFLDDVLDEVFRYIRERYECEHIALVLLDPVTNEFHIRRALYPEHFTEEECEFADSFRTLATPDAGIYWSAYNKSKLIYYPEQEGPPASSVGQLFHRRLPYCSILMAPLILRQEVMGLLALMNYRQPLLLSPAAVLGLGRVCDQVAGAIQMSTLLREMELARNREHEARREAEQSRKDLEEEIQMAARLQESLLPQKLPEPPEASIAYRYVPMLAVGGDFLDLHYARGENLLGFFVCDVSGHGVDAAFLASMVKMALRNWDKLLLGPARILERIRNRLRDKMAGHTITACVGSLDLTTGRGRVAVAGHPPPIIIRAHGDVESLNVKGHLLMDHPLWKGTREEKDFQLNREDKLLLFTDGLLEVRSPQDWMLGEDKLVSWLGRGPYASPDELCDDIQEYVRRFAGGQELDDDFTILAVEYLK